MKTVIFIITLITCCYCRPKSDTATQGQLQENDSIAQMQLEEQLYRQDSIGLEISGVTLVYPNIPKFMLIGVHLRNNTATDYYFAFPEIAKVYYPIDDPDKVNVLFQGFYSIFRRENYQIIEPIVIGIPFAPRPEENFSLAMQTADSLMLLKYGLEDDIGRAYHRGIRYHDIKEFGRSVPAGKQVHFDLIAPICLTESKQFFTREKFIVYGGFYVCEDHNIVQLELAIDSTAINNLLLPKDIAEVEARGEHMYYGRIRSNIYRIK
ncbi:MAG: hypothetical protein Q4F57_04160 [Weeksellaceae bacterium]|nr:hypothetical protein [Weeksellaceae bacterium]